ncbi:rhodanese-like domain-containing protein [uncultured Desulfuromusa sp.]|uniref:rhodanese-like domain-containing protein n=1 Tax=uncultured Desulfuromusa sp. TaxID=219183 RepID=UPI002AA6FAB7|nr:rhodanese-like domain-containing protein [uncultured Desulfuromusa sp.]
MKRKIFLLLILVTYIGIVAASAAEKPNDPKKQTAWNLYVDSKEAYAMKQKLGNRMLFIDVRDPIEIMFTGFTDIVDINIPFKIANRNVWNEKKSVFLVELNPNFEQDIAAALSERGLTKDSPIVLMCRSGGTRGAPATKSLENKGYKQIYVVTDGFEGDKIKDGERKNWRLKNGWKNSGLPWSYKLNKEKMYFHQ